MLRYISPETQINLKTFKYKGGSASLTYEYLWSPFAEYLLKFTPQWIAPNLITLVAFIIVVISHLIFMFYGTPALGHPIPAWKCLLMGFTLLIYQHLDNMDGKQARRTRNSTPIGMLFDHGADAITAVLFGLQIAAMFGVQNKDLCAFLMVYFVLYPNFVGLWNQYSIGHFNLDRINPIDQGLPTYALFAFGGAFINYFGFFNTHHIYAKWNQQILFLVALAITFTVLKLNRDLLTSELLRKKQDIYKKLLLPIILVSTLLIWRFFVCPSIFQRFFYPIYYLLTFMWARNMMLMQVSYVTKQRFHSLNIGTVTYLLIWIGSTVLFLNDYEEKIIYNFLFLGMIVQLIALMQFIISFLNQAKHILGIHLFRINLPPQQKKD